jgi:hypothetical protein
MRHLVTVVVALVIVMAVSGVLTPGGRERGIAAFKDPFEAELAAAIVAFDVPRVKAFLPRATYQNLNDLRGNTTLFTFALEQGGGPASPERLEMVKALLKARGSRGIRRAVRWRRWRIRMSGSLPGCLRGGGGWRGMGRGGSRWSC